MGEDDDGYKVMIKLKYYLRYLDDDAEGAGRDDSPLYAFDSSFGDHAVKKSVWLKKALLIPPSPIPTQICGGPHVGPHVAIEIPLRTPRLRTRAPGPREGARVRQ